MMAATDDLLTRLREHAAVHDATTSPYDDEPAQVAQDLRKAAVEIERLRDAYRMLNGLLKTIHCDHGDYIAEHGMKKACDEATNILYKCFGWI